MTLTIRSCAAGIESGGTEGEEDDDGPLLSWKAHKGWVAGLAFASAPTASGATGERLLLTASNDKTVSRTIIAGVRPAFSKDSSEDGAGRRCCGT